MTTYPHRIHVHRPHINWPLVAIVGLAAAFVGLGSWVLVDRYAGGGGATQDATTLIDKFNVAVSRSDEKAMADLLTSDAVLLQSDSTLTGGKAIANMIATHGSQTLDRITPVVVNGEYATTFVHFTSLGGVMDRPQLEVFQIKDGKLARIWGFAFGENAPFHNIAR